MLRSDKFAISCEQNQQFNERWWVIMEKNCINEMQMFHLPNLSVNGCKLRHQIMCTVLGSIQILKWLSHESRTTWSYFENSSIYDLKDYL